MVVGGAGEGCEGWGRRRGLNVMVGVAGGGSHGQHEEREMVLEDIRTPLGWWF